jgi:hypothetical protein
LKAGTITFLQEVITSAISSCNYQRNFELTGLLKAKGYNHFEIWEPHDKNRRIRLLVLEGESLASDFCVQNRIWETSANVFHSFGVHHAEEFDIHPDIDYCMN